MGDECEFKIKITTSSDASGAREAKAELDGLSPKTQKYIQDLKGTGEAAEGVHIKHRALRFMLRQMGPEMAHLGHAAIYGMANPMVLGLIAVSAAVGKLIKDHEKLKEAIGSAPDLDGIKKTNEALGYNGMLKAMIEGGVAAEEFWGKIERMANAQETLKDKTEDATKAIKDQVEADNKTLSAKEKAELAELKLAKAKGEITEEQYNQRKGAIEDRFEGQRSNNKALAESAAIAGKKAEREGQAGILRDGPEVVIQAQIAADRAKGEADTQKAQLEEWKKKLEEVDKWMKENLATAMGSAEGRQKISEMEKTRSLAQTEVASREQLVVPESEIKAKGAAADLASAERKVEEARKRMTELDREIPKLEGDAKRDAATRGEEGAAHRRTRAAEGEEATWEKISASPEGKLLKQGADLEALKESGGRLTVQQSSQLAGIKSMLDSHGENGAAMLHALAAADRNSRVLSAQIEAMAKRMDAFAKQQRNGASPN